MSHIEGQGGDEGAGPRPSGKGAPPAAGDTLGAIVARPAEAPAKAGKPRKDAKPAKEKAKPGKAMKAKKAKPAKAAKAPKAKRVALKLRVPADVDKAFRKAAAAQKLKRGAFLARIFADWRSRNPA